MYSTVKTLSPPAFTIFDAKPIKPTYAVGCSAFREDKSGCPSSDNLVAIKLFDGPAILYKKRQGLSNSTLNFKFNSLIFVQTSVFGRAIDV